MYYLDILKKYLWLVKMLTIALAAFLSANAVSIGIRGAVSTTTTLDLAQKDAGGSAYVPLSDYEIIVKRSLFNSEGVNMDGGFSSQQSMPVLSMGVFELMGTMAGVPQHSYAVIKNRTSGLVGVYKIGDWVLANATKVLDIKRQWVLLENNGEEQVLTMQGISALPGFASGDRWKSRGDMAKTISEGIKKLGEGDFVIDRALIDEAFANMGSLMRGARIMPKFERGQITGFKIMKIKKKSLYEKIGLKNGDIIHRLNSVEIQGPEDALRLFGELRSASSISIDITRKGQRQTLNYQVR